MKKYLFIPIILSFCLLRFSASAQKFPDTSLVRPGEVVFVSPFEQQLFFDLLENKQLSWFDLFLCNDSIVTPAKAKEYETVFKGVTGQFSSDYYQQMNEKKKVQKIYSSVHDEMLGKYTPLVPFSSIFSTKEYHCVSSSMLYALVFEELKIPYEIRTIPGHVYLVAYPATSYIIVETTDPLHGTLIFDQAFKANFIEYLRDSKLISKEEFYGNDVETLFKKYFNQSKVIDHKGLASIQYQNQFFSCSEGLRYRAAMENQKKAWLLNPDTANTYLLYFSLATDYAQLDKGELECARQLGILSRFSGKGITSEDIIGEFAQITQKQLLYEGNDILYDSSYNVLNSNITDTILSGEISFLYNYERGRILCNNFEFENAIPYTLMAFELKPRNSDAKNNFMLALNNTIKTQSPVEKLELVNRIADEVPVLLEDNLFAQLRLSMYLMMMDISFYEKDAVRGEEYRKQFETIYPERNNKYLYIDSDISRAYGTASSYYFRLGRNDKTRAILEKGLEYAPDDFDLKNRLNAVK
jgi:hypothetical protein